MKSGVLNVGFQLLCEQPGNSMCSTFAPASLSDIYAFGSITSGNFFADSMSSGCSTL